MDFANRGNRPIQQQQPQQQPAPHIGGSDDNSSASSNKGDKKKLDFGKMSSLFLLFGGTLLIAVLIIALVFGGKDDTTTNTETSLIQSDKYQAVFLNSQDGQVYFGKLSVYNDDLYVLNDIYYVRVENPVQPEGQNQQQQANISLAKLGNELHGPQDVMYIQKDQVLFWENLKDDGQVVKAITDFKANGETSTNNDAAGTNEAGSDDANTNDTDTTTP